jgi:hypothetical protein
MQTMQPEMQEGVFVFCALSHGKDIPAGIPYVCMFREQEGTTLIMKEEEARKAGLTHQFPSRQITLNVHSALDAVGFLAAVLAPLAKAGISVNPVSAFYHDHLFVPADRAGDALKILRILAGA